MSMVKKEPPSAQPTNQQEVINSINTRVRLAEERTMELRRKITLIEHNVLKMSKKITQDNKLLRDELTDTKQSIRNIEDRLIAVIKELQITPKKEDVDLVKKYVEYWNPVKFVTIDKIEEYVRDALQEINEGKD